MRYLILISFVALSCGPKVPAKTNEAAIATLSPATDIPYTIAERYFVRNDYRKQDHPNPKITSKETFDSFFGMAGVMGATPTAIDFSKQFVLAVIGEPTDKKTQMIPVSLQEREGAMVFTYKTVVGEQQSATIQPVLIIIVENKYKGEIKLAQAG